MPDRPNADLPDRERTPVEERRDWEVIQQNETERTERLMLWHGWLYRTITNGGDVAMVFVPEPRVKSKLADHRAFDEAVQTFQDALDWLYAAHGTFGLAVETLKKRRASHRMMSECEEICYKAQMEIENRYCALDPKGYRTWIHQFYRANVGVTPEPCDAWFDGDYGEWDEPRVNLGEIRRPWGDVKG